MSAAANPATETLAALLLTACAFVATATPVDKKANDLYWHLSAGRAIVSERRVPRTDELASARLGAAWTDFEWLAQAAAYGVERRAGLGGLILLKASLLAGAVLLAFRLARRQGVPWPAAAAGAGFWLWSLCYRDYLRPEVLTYILLPAMMTAAAAPPPWDRRRLVLLGALFALWANLHGGFVMGLAWLSAESVGRQAEHSLLDGRPGLCPRARVLAAAAAAGALGALLNPYGAEVYRVPMEHVRLMAAQRGTPWEVTEWRPAAFAGNEAFWGWTALVLAVAAVAQARRRRPDFPGLLVLAAFLVPAVRYTRNAQLFILASLPILARHLAWSFDGFAAAPAATRAWRAAALAALCLGTWNASSRFAPREVPGDYPVRAADFLAREGLAGNLYNSYTWGGYLGWRLLPAKKSFMDSRYLFTELLGEEFRARAAPPDWEDFVNRYGLTHAVVPYPGGFKAVPRRRLAPAVLARPPRSPLMSLFPPEGWALLFWDGTALVFARRGSGNDEAISRLEYRFRPDDYLYADFLLRTGVLDPAVLRAELERNAATAGRHPAVRFFGDFFAVYGPPDRKAGDHSSGSPLRNRPKG